MCTSVYEQMHVVLVPRNWTSLLSLALGAFEYAIPQ